MVCEAVDWVMFGLVVVLFVAVVALSSQAVLTSDDQIWRTLAYIVAVFDAWFMGAVFGVLACNDVCRGGDAKQN